MSRPIMAAVQRIGAASMVAVVILLGCTGSGTPRAARDPGSQPVAERKTITAAVMGNLQTVSSLLTGGGRAEGGSPGTSEVGALLNLGLTGNGLINPREPLLAEAVPSLENGLWTLLPDGRMKTTWHIRPNVLWHDGVPVDTQDLLFTARAASDRQLPTVHERQFDLVEGIEAPDGRTITVTWTQPYIEADQLFGTGAYLPMPRHLLEDAYTNAKDTFLNLPYWNREFVGTGPYRLREFVDGSHLVLEAADQFVLGRPRIDEIVVKFIPDPGTLMANVLADAVDIVLGRSVSLAQGADLRNQWPNGTVSSVTADPRSLVPQHINPTPAVVANVQFRKALWYGIDRGEMAATLGLGLAPAADVGIALEDPVYHEVEPALVRYNHDPRQAMAMIEGLGYSRGPDGVFIDSANQPLEVPLRSSEREVNINVIHATAQYWNRIGVRTMLEVILTTQRQASAEASSRFPGFETGGGNYAGLNALGNLRASQVPSPQNAFLGQNRGGYVNAELEGLVDRYFVTIPMAERIQTLRSIFHHITDQVVVIPLYYDANPFMTSNRVANVSAGYLGNAFQWDRK